MARVYEKLIDSRSIYKEEQIRIPTPEFIVLYNGEKEYPEEGIMKLSEAYMEKQAAITLERV